MTATVEALRLRSIQLPRVAVRVRALAPAGAYLAGQLVTLLFALLVAHGRHRSLYEALRSWDGQWFLDVAEHGYKTTVESGGTVAFFPGYPMLLRALHAVTRVGYQPVGIVVSISAGAATAYGLMRLVADRRTGLILVALFATAPMSVILAMTYSEAVFCALAVWALVAIRDERWLAAAALIVAAGLTRSTAVALFAALVVAVVLAARAGRATWQAVAALAVAPLGFVGYAAWVSHATRTPFGLFAAERKGWGTHFDFGRMTAVNTYRTLTYAPSLYGVATIAGLVAAVVLLVPLFREHGAVLASYAGVVVAIDVLVDGVWASKVRLLIPAFVLLAPIATRIARRPGRRAWTALAMVAAIGVWFSSFMLLMFGFGI